MLTKKSILFTILILLTILAAACAPDTSELDAARSNAATAEARAAQAESEAATAQAEAAAAAEDAAASESEVSEAQAAAATAQAEAEAAMAEADAARAEAEAAQQEEPEEVSLAVWYLSQNPEEIELMQGMGDRFEEDHPGVTVEFSPYSFADMNNTLRLALDGGVGPDVAYASPGASHGSAYAAAGHLVDLTSIAEERGWTENFSQDVIAYWNDDPDQVFQMPFDLVTVGVYYNVEMFDELGLEEPETFEEFENILATVKEAGITPIGVGALDGWPLAHIWSQLVHTSVPIDYIASLETADPSVGYDHPAIVAAAEKINEWNEVGYFQDNVLATEYADGNNLFITEQAALNVGGTWNNSTFAEQPDFEVGFFAMPQVDPSLEWHMGGFTPNNAWMIPVYTPHQELAVEYVDFMLSEEVALAKWNDGEIPAYQFEEVPEPVALLQEGVYIAMQKAMTGFYLGNINSEIQQAIWNNLQSMLAGEVTPEEAMSNVQEVYDQVAQAQ